MLANKAHKDALRAIMASRGLTGYQVARILKVKPQTAYAYMCGVRAISLQQLARVDRATAA